MARRYGMNTPDVLRRRQNIADQQAAAYQARLMPNPGTPAWSQGLETSTPFFDIATVGMGGGLNLLRKGIARKLAESRLRRQPAYTTPNVVGQQFRKSVDEDLFPNLSPGENKGIMDRLKFDYGRLPREELSVGTTNRIMAEARKQGKINRAAVARRRRMQGSMGDDL